MTPAEGTVVGNYRITGKLGEGGMGAVYRAVDTMIQREVAIKALRPEIAAQPDVLERFRSEAVLLAKLNHPAVAQLYAFFSETGQFYMVMEYVAGDTFERVIQKQGAIDWQKALAYLIQILDGISHAHSNGILHRDLKPANVMLTPGGKIKLMDFGIAQALGGARMTRQGRIIGTLEYLAPERIQGKPADARSDLYSVGVMLFEMLSGRLPFQSDSEYELLQAHIQQPVPPLGSLGVKVPTEVEAIMRKALEKDPANRYSDAEDFASAVAALLPVRRTESKPIPLPFPPPVGAQPLPAQPVAPQPVSAAPQKLTSKPMFWIGSAAGLSVLAGGIFFAAVRQPSPAKIADNGQPAIYTPPPTPAPLVVNTTPVVIEPPKPAPARPAPETPAPKQPRPAPADAPRTAPPPSPTPAPVQQAPAPAPTPVPNNPVEPAPEPAPPPVQQRPLPIQPQPSGIVRLSDARTIYISGSQGILDSYLREEIQRQLGVRLRVVASPAQADVLMRVTLLEDRGGKGIASAGRILGVKDRTTVRAMIVEPRSNRILWQQGAGDRKPIIGSFHGDSLQRLAERLVRELREAYGR
jgi:serine/threonine-protein kinase